jgi:hypothetical protein
MIESWLQSTGEALPPLLRLRLADGSTAPPLGVAGV